MSNPSRLRGKLSIPIALHDVSTVGGIGVAASIAATLLGCFVTSTVALAKEEEPPVSPSTPSSASNTIPVATVNFDDGAIDASSGYAPLSLVSSAAATQGDTLAQMRLYGREEGKGEAGREDKDNDDLVAAAHELRRTLTPPHQSLFRVVCILVYEDFSGKLHRLTGELFQLFDVVPTLILPGGLQLPFYRLIFFTIHSFDSCRGKSTSEWSAVPKARWEFKVRLAPEEQ